MADHGSVPVRVFLGSIVLVYACRGPESAPTGLGSEPEACDAEPRAWVLAPAYEAASARLARAGFSVEPLPLDRSPRGLQGLVLLGSDASEMPGYAAYMQEYADDLRDFVGAANVLLQLPQSSATEPTPPFLPAELAARRGSSAIEEAHVLAPDHPLLTQVEFDGDRLAWRGEVGRDAFVEHDGFEVVLAGAGEGGVGALLAGDFGRGRIVLSALPLDGAPGAVPEQEAFIDAFFANLAVNATEDCLPDVPPPPMTTPPDEPMPFAAGSTMFAVLPDTQYYSLRYPGVFDTQTSWIARQAEELNIAYVFHLGDIVHTNTDLEWRHASASMSLLDGIVPYGLVPGNHDYGPSGLATTRETGLNNWFSFDDVELMPTFGGAYQPGRLDNTYHLFDAGGHAWVALLLEWGPRDEVVAWANAVMEDHPDRLGVLVTHAYLYYNDRRYDHTDTTHPQAYNPHYYDTPGSMNDGEELWDKLVRRHHFVLTLSGHVTEDGTGYLASVNDRGNVVHQMLSNYQMRDIGGEGFLRLLELLPDGRTMVVRTYSPLLDQYLRAADQQFTIELDVD